MRICQITLRLLAAAFHAAYRAAAATALPDARCANRSRSTWMAAENLREHYYPYTTVPFSTRPYSTAELVLQRAAPPPRGPTRASVAQSLTLDGLTHTLDFSTAFPPEFDAASMRPDELSSFIPIPERG